ncbi:MAG TPA: hypothetical protein VNB94_06400 [Mycobacteriales bacterium]|nr:hypothetical protein [Mycobacteriales bacterium]
MIKALVHATTFRTSLDPVEVATTVAAVVVSTGLYLREGHDYLARGVVGDLIGLAILAMPLILVRRRGRHEALTCLVAIGVVRLLDPQWPLARSESFWWGTIAVGLAAYIALRRRRLIALR